MAAALACGEDAALSHDSGVALFGIRNQVGPPHISVPADRGPTGRRHIRVHRRVERITSAATSRFGIPVLPVVQCLVDIAPGLTESELDRAVNEADRLELVRAGDLRSALAAHACESGVAVLRGAIDLRTFVLNRSELERRFLPIARRVGLPRPRTCVYVNGFEVDFWWPELRLVVETDGLRYHRTASQQARDRRRDQAHQAAGDHPLRFTHAQVRYESAYVERILGAVVGRLRASRIF